MIVKINKQDIDAVRHVCAVSDVTCNFYTIESSGGLVQVELTYSGGVDIPNDHVWHIAMMVERRSWETALREPA